MNGSTLSLAAINRSAAGPQSLARPGRMWPRALAAALATALAAVAAWRGGVVGAAACPALAAAMVWLLWPRRPARAQAKGADFAVESGSRVMVNHVVPMWGRQAELARKTADDGMQALLTTFSEISGGLDRLAADQVASAASLSPGAADDAIGQHAGAIETMLEPMTRAFAQRDAAVRELGQCATMLAELSQLTKQVRELARHTRLVAFNASIEANRIQSGDGGYQAVANEVRSLAARSAEAGEQIDRRVSALYKTINAAHRAGELNDTNSEELRVEVQIKAREALTTLLNDLGANMKSSIEMREVSASLRDQIEQVFVHLQFGDRLSQMLDILGQDMNRLTLWLADNRQATAADARQWLAELEARYTTQEQRSEHHGNVSVNVASNVDFF